MPRVSYQTSTGATGQLRLEELRAGDVITFLEGYVRPGDGDALHTSVAPGEVGDVVDVDVNTGQVVVHVPATHGREFRLLRLSVPADAVTAMLDPRDPRQ